VAAEKNSTLVMPVPVELLRFFDKFTPPSSGGAREPGEDSASLADFGNEDVAKEEAEIESGAPLEIPEVPSIPAIPADLGGGKQAEADADSEASTDEIEPATVPAQGRGKGTAAASRKNSAEEAGS
jgi:hypothetical protein